MTIYDVISCLEELDQLHTSLLELAHEKKAVIIANDIPRLNQLVNKEGQLVRQLGDVEAKRMETVNQFMVARCYRPNPKVTISDLVQLLFKAEEKRALMAIQTKLAEATVLLQAANELNQKLIQQSLDYLDYSIDLLISPDDSQESTYHRPTGTYQTHQRSGFFDART